MLLDVIFLVVIIYLLKSVSDIKKRLFTLPDKSVPTSPQHVENKPEDVVVDASQPAEVSSHEKDVVASFLEWFARDWPLKVGAIFLLFGCGWFLTYAFMNNLIGPIGRLGLGLFGGAAIMVFGNLRIRKNIYQGEIIATLGAGILLSTIFASEHVYTALIRNLYPQWASLILVSLVIASLAFTSYKNKTIRMVTLAYVIGVVAPFIVGFSVREIVGIFGYLLALTIGLIWLVRVTGWRMLIVLPLATVTIFTLMYRYSLHLSPDENLWMQFFSITFTCIFYLSSLIAFSTEKSREKLDLLIGVLLSVYCFLWVVAFIPDHNRSIVLVIFSMVFMVGAYILRRMKSIDDAIYLYFIVSVIFLVVATFFQFKVASVLPIVLSCEALLLLIFTDRIYTARSVKVVSLLFIPPILLSLQLFQVYSRGYSYPSYGNLNLNSGQIYDIQLILINIILYISAFYAYFWRQYKEIIVIGKMLFVASAVFTLYFLWQVIPYHTMNINNPFGGKTVVLIIFVLIGITSYFYGIHNLKLWTKRFGLLLSSFVIIRLLFFEIWSMPIEAKIVTFIVIGIIFMLSVFIQIRMHEKKIL